jgi:hypothetical protein
MRLVRRRCGSQGKLSRRISGMQMDKGDALLLELVTEPIIGCAFRVANALGHGFAEQVYELSVIYRRPDSRGSGHRRTQGGLRAERSAVPVPQRRKNLRATGKLPCVRLNAGRPKVKSAASPPPSRGQSPKPDRKNYPLHPRLSRFIRLKKEKLPQVGGP